MEKTETSELINKRKELILSVFAVILLMVAVIGVTYAVFVFTKTGSTKNTISSGTITFTYTSDTNGISITNAEPISDSEGKKILAQSTQNGIIQGYFDFTVGTSIVGTTTVQYEVNATYDSATANLLDPNYVKVYLTDGQTIETAIPGFDGAIMPNYNSLENSTITAGAKKLYQGTFTKTDSKKFRLRIWVASNYTMYDTSKTFKMKVNVTAVSS